MAEQKTNNPNDDENGGILLKQEAFPEKAKRVTSFIGVNKEQNKQTILSGNHKDRRQKYDKLPMKILSNCDKVDITQYLVKLTMQFGDKFYIGTGNIFRIVQNTLYILTCAHNAITFHPYKNQCYHANNIWIKFQNEEYSANKFYIYPNYTRKYRLGNDLAVIECKLVESFMFYQIFPTLKSLQNSIGWSIKQEIKNTDWKLNLNADATKLSMWMVKSMTNVAYKTMSRSFSSGIGDDDNNGNYIDNGYNGYNKNKKKGMDDEYKGEIYGYPGDKNGECWGMIGDVVVLENEYLISYDNIDTTGGQSGAAIWVNGEIVGVHTNGDYLGVKENYGCMLTVERIEWINSVIPCQVGVHPKYYDKQ